MELCMTGKNLSSQSTIAAIKHVFSAIRCSRTPMYAALRFSKIHVFCLALAIVKTAFKFIGLALFSSILFAQAQPSKQEKEVTTIQVNKSEPAFVLTLDSNPTTGYSWFLGRYDSERIEPIKKNYEISHPKRAGSGGQEHWFFKLKSDTFVVPTILTIEMIYVRPWALHDIAKTKTFKIVANP